MKKKYLATLLFIPLLLASCGGNKEEGTAGAKGEAILTEEQLDALTITELDDFRTSSFAKVGKLNFASDLLAYSGTSTYSQMFGYNDMTNHKIEAYSLLTSAKIFTLEETDKYDDLDFYYEDDLYAALGLESLSVATHYINEESKDVYSYKYIDAFGHVLFEKTSEEDIAYEVTAFTRNYPIDNLGNKYKNDHFVRTSYFDAKAKKQVIQYYKYSDDLATVTKVDKYNDESIYGNLQYRFKFSVTEKVKKEEVKTDYIVSLEYKSDTSTIIEVSHQGEEAMVYDRYYVPVMFYNLILFDHHALYQVNHQLNDHVDEYTYDNGSTFYNLETFVIDLKEGTTTKVEFPYVLAGGLMNIEEGPEGEPFALDQHCIVRVRAIENKILSPIVESYLIDSELVLHDNLTHVPLLTKIGEGYLDDNNNLYDASKNKVGSIDTNTYDIYERYPTCLVLKTGNGALTRYGVINEKGEWLVPCRFANIAPINGEVVRLYNSTSDHVYFNLKTLTSTVPTFGKDTSYTMQANDAVYVIRAGDTEGAKEAVYFLGNKVDEFAKVSSLILNSAIVLSDFADSEWKSAYTIIETTETDGSRSYHTYRNDVR